MIDVTVDRDKFTGGSDLPIIMGISPFKSRFDLLLEKAGYLENDFKGNEFTQFGNVLEPKIRKYINESLYPKDNFREDTFIDGDLRANVDGVNKAFILEIKTTSQIKNDLDDYKLYLVQLLFYMKVAKKKKGMLAVYERPSDFNEEFDENRLQTFMIDVANFKELIEEIEVAIEQFRIDLKKVKENPLITEEDLQPKELIKMSNEVVMLEQQLIGYEETIKKRDKLKKDLKTAMEKYGVKKWITPNDTKITLVADGEDKEIEVFNEDNFKKDNEELYKKYLEKKITKGRSGYVKITLEKQEEIWK